MFYRSTNDGIAHDQEFISYQFKLFPFVPVVIETINSSCTSLLRALRLFVFKNP